MLNRLLLLSFILIISACGGGTRGTGEVTFSGTAASVTGTPLSSATVTLLATGDSAITDTNGQFQIVTNAFSGTVEFAVEAQGQEVISSGGSIDADATEVDVSIRIDFSKPKPQATQDIEVRRRRGQGENNSGSGSGSSGGDNSGSKPDKSGPKGPTGPTGSDGSPSDDHGNSNSGGKDNNGNSGSGSGSGNGSSGNPGKGDDSGDDDNGPGGSGPAPDSSATPTPSPRNPDSGSDDDQEVRERGTISALTSNSLTVNGTQFFVDESTEFDKRRALAEFSIGENVEVRAQVQNGVLIASEVKLRD